MTAQHDLVRDPYLNCRRCQKMFRNEDDARGARCRPRKDRGFAVWRTPEYWADKRARQKRSGRNTGG
jgi:hypothetical protein